MSKNINFLYKQQRITAIKTSQFDTSRQVNLTHQDKSNLHTNDTDINKTEYSETEKSIGIRQPKQLKHNFAENVN